MIGEIIKHMRVSAGLSQTQLADKLGIAQTTLSGYETNSSKPNYEIVEQIATICEFELILRDKNSNEKIYLNKK